MYSKFEYGMEDCQNREEKLMYSFFEYVDKYYIPFKITHAGLRTKILST